MLVSLFVFPSVLFCSTVYLKTAQSRLQNFEIGQKNFGFLSFLAIVNLFHTNGSRQGMTEKKGNYNFDHADLVGVS